MTVTPLEPRRPKGSVTVGIDPGMDGAIAILVDGQPVRIHDMPTTSITRRSKGRKRTVRSIDIDGAARLIEQARDLCAPAQTPIVVIENVMARPGEAAAGAFRFGSSFGALCMAPAVLGWAWCVVRPQVWKPAVGLPDGSDKGAALDLARSMWPEVELFKFKKHHGRADACLLAHWSDTFNDGTAA